MQTVGTSACGPSIAFFENTMYARKPVCDGSHSRTFSFTRGLCTSIATGGFGPKVRTRCSYPWRTFFIGTRLTPARLDSSKPYNKPLERTPLGCANTGVNTRGDQQIRGKYGGTAGHSRSEFRGTRPRNLGRAKSNFVAQPRNSRQAATCHENREPRSEQQPPAQQSKSGAELPRSVAEVATGRAPRISIVLRWGPRDI